MNKVIKHYVSSKHDLPRFFEHFQRFLDDRRYDELKADFNANHSIVSISMPTELLKHAASVYTPEVFTLFRAELTKSFDCVIESSRGGEMEEVVIYSVRHVKKLNGKLVSYNVGEETVSCSCRKFVFSGILCCHILKTFSDKGITRCWVMQLCIILVSQVLMMTNLSFNSLVSLHTEINVIEHGAVLRS